MDIRNIEFEPTAVGLRGLEKQAGERGVALDILFSPISIGRMSNDADEIKRVFDLSYEMTQEYIENALEEVS